MLVRATDAQDVAVAVWDRVINEERVGVEDVVCVFDCVIDRVPLDDPVEVFVVVTELVEVLVFCIVLVETCVLEKDGEADEVLEPRAVRVPQGLPDTVLDAIVVLDKVGLALDVLDCVVEPVVVLEAVVVLVDVPLPVCVFEGIDVRVASGDAEAVFVSAAVLVNGMVGLIVRDGNGLGLAGLDSLAEYVDVVVFVDVLDIVPVVVGTIPRLRSILNSSRRGGVVATKPIDNKIISHFMPIYYKANVSFFM